GSANLRIDVAPPRNSRVQYVVLSPDGGQILMAATRAGAPSTLWLLSPGTHQPHPLSGTDGAAYPFWSPDGSSIGFFADGKLKRVSVSGAEPIALCDAVAPRGGTWNRSGTIVFGVAGGGLRQVAEAGGTPTLFTQLDGGRQEDSHRWPSFLPDGRRVL